VVRFAPLIAGLPLLLAAASAQVGPSGPQPAAELAQARAEQAAAEAQVARLQKAASQARDEATRFRVQQDAAAQTVEAAEARITAANAQMRLASAYVAAHRAQLYREQRPIASLLAGLATMAERPPLLALADRRGTDELVKVRILLDSTLPVIRGRTAQLSRQLAEGEKLEQAAIAARSEIARSRSELTAKRQQFAALERRAIDRSLAQGSEALGAGDVAIAAGEDVERLQTSEANSREALRTAAAIAAADPAPPRPTAPEGGAERLAPFSYRLPANARVTQGVGFVNQSGVQSRGLTLATVRGAPLVAPAGGIVRYAGPFRDYDGILILDHGGGWMSLIVNLASPLQRGARVALGDPIGRALGETEVELSQNGRRVSPALIAGSSASLSKAGKGG